MHQVPRCFCKGSLAYCVRIWNHTSDDVKIAESLKELRAPFARKYKTEQKSFLVTTSTTVRTALDLPAPTIHKKTGVSAHQCFREVSAINT